MLITSTSEYNIYITVDFYVLYRTTKSEKMASRIITLGHCQKSVQNLNKKTQFIWQNWKNYLKKKTPLKAAMGKAVFSEVEKDCAAMYSKKLPSVLKHFSRENVATFSLVKLNIEIQKKLHCCMESCNILRKDPLCELLSLQQWPWHFATTSCQHYTT